MGLLIQPPPFQGAAGLEQRLLKILKKHPHDLAACTNLGQLYAGQGRFSEAITLYRSGLAKHPNDPLLHANLANALCACRLGAEAYEHARRAVEIDPREDVGWINLSWACALLMRHDEAEQAARQVLALRPGNVMALNNLASALKEQGKLHQAVELYRQVVQSDPDLDFVYVNLLLAMLYDMDSSLVDILQVTGLYAARFEAPLLSLWPVHRTTPDPWRRVRLGILSPDFNDHSIMYFVEPLLARLDRRQFELVAYYTYPEGTGDHVTERVRRFAGRFVYLGNLQPAEQADRIMTDGIDILLDTAGHTAQSGLLAMARKPAPVQVTWLGYPGTTGLTSIDWRITDTVADKEPRPAAGLPPLEAQYSEKLAFLPPPFCVYRPCIRNPLQRYWPQYQVQSAPVHRTGFITFGSCNNLAKLTPNVLTLWGSLLQRIPTARLLIEGKGFGNPETARTYREKCILHGIPAERLVLIPFDSKNQYLVYHQIDIALDPFPLTGGTTTIDLLWMGVPLVSMRGESFRGRMGMSFLTAVGFTDWIAETEEEYLAIAERLASDIPALNSMRLQQRKLLEQSPLLDETRFVELFEEALRQMWLKWCARQTAPENPDATFRHWLESSARSPRQEALVFLEPEGGQGTRLDEAYRLLQNRLAKARTDGDGCTSGVAPFWQEVIRLARLIIESRPKDVQALAALAEAEYVHANTQAAIAYLSHAVEASPQSGPLYQCLINWYREAGNEQAALTVSRIMKQRGAQAGG